MDRAGTSRSLDPHLPTAADAADNMDITLLRHRVPSSESADEGEDERDDQEQE